MHCKNEGVLIFELQICNRDITIAIIGLFVLIHFYSVGRSGLSTFGNQQYKSSGTRDHASEIRYHPRNSGTIKAYDVAVTGRKRTLIR